jgi:hypothetical protein
VRRIKKQTAGSNPRFVKDKTLAYKLKAASRIRRQCTGKTKRFCICRRHKAKYLKATKPYLMPALTTAKLNGCGVSIIFIGYGGGANTCKAKSLLAKP